MSYIDDSIRIAGIIEESTVDGPGIRFTIFTQGCPHRCPRCHNPETHNPVGGVSINIEDIIRRIRSNPLIDGITVSGGEPFLQPGPVSKLLGRIRQETEYSIMVYTGYYLNELRMSEDAELILRYTDILVEGPFMIDKRCHDLPYRGSSNQNVIAFTEAGKEILNESGI